MDHEVSACSNGHTARQCAVLDVYLREEEEEVLVVETAAAVAVAVVLVVVRVMDG